MTHSQESIVPVTPSSPMTDPVLAGTAPATIGSIVVRAIALCDQVPQLHELSYDLGVMGSDASPETAPAHFAICRAILESAALLRQQLRQFIAESVERPRADPVLPIQFPASEDRKLG